MANPKEDVSEEDTLSLEDLAIRMLLNIAQLIVIPISFIWAVNLVLAQNLEYNIQTIAAVSVVLLIMDNLFNGKRTKRAEPEAED